MMASEELPTIQSPDVVEPGETPLEEQPTTGSGLAPTHLETGPGLRYRITFLSLLYRYLICLFWIGLITALTMTALLLYESAALTKRLLAE